MGGEELISVIDLYEDDTVVLTNATYKSGHLIIVRYEIGVKDENGDIYKFIRIRDLSVSLDDDFFSADKKY